MILLYSYSVLKMYVAGSRDRLMQMEIFKPRIVCRQSFLHHFTLLYYPWVYLSWQCGRTAVSRGVRLEERGDHVSGSTRVA